MVAWSAHFGRAGPGRGGPWPTGGSLGLRRRGGAARWEKLREDGRTIGVKGVHRRVREHDGRDPLPVHGQGTRWSRRHSLSLYALYALVRSACLGARSLIRFYLCPPPPPCPAGKSVLALQDRHRKQRSGKTGKLHSPSQHLRLGSDFLCRNISEMLPILHPVKTIVRKLA